MKLPLFGWAVKRLEVEASAELQGAACSPPAGDVAESCSADGDVVRSRELGVVEKVERLHANLELTLLIDMESTEDAGVDKSRTRSAELVAVGIAEVRSDHAGRLAAVDVVRCGGDGVVRFGRVRERRGIEPWSAPADRTAGALGVAAELSIGLDQIRVESVARSVEGCV